MRTFTLSGFRVPIAVLSVLSLALLAGCEGGSNAPSKFYYDYKEYLEESHYRAFAYTGEAGWFATAGFAHGFYTVETAIKKALDLCKEVDTSEVSIRAGQCYLHSIGTIKVYDMTDEQLKKAIALYKTKPNATNADLALTGKKEEIARPAKEGSRLSAAAYDLEGRSYAREKNYEAAIDAYKKALEVNPNYHIAYDNLGNAYLGKGSYDNALVAYRKALEIKPNYELAHVSLGRLYRIMRRYDDSKSELEKAMELNPDSAYPHRELCWTLKEMGKKADAIEACEQAVALGPDSKFNYAALALVYGDTGKLEDAISTLKKALAIDPDYLLAHQALARIYRRQGKTEKAEEHSNIARKLRK